MKRIMDKGILIRLVDLRKLKLNLQYLSRTTSIKKHFKKNSNKNLKGNMFWIKIHEDINFGANKKTKYLSKEKK